MRWTANQKYRLCQVVSFGGVVGTLCALSQMSPWTSPHHNKIVFACVLVIALVTLPCMLGMYYYRAQRKNIDIDLTRTEATILDQAGKAIKAESQPPSTPSSNTGHPSNPE